MNNNSPEDTENYISPYSVELDVFNGPLDLLLHLIKKDKLDVYDIPIALVTQQYLEYLEFLREVRLEVVGDYLSMAAELGYIKSRMLLPKIKSEDEQEDEEDPREELVRRLLEYERYRDAATELGTAKILGKEVFLSGYDRREVFGEPKTETEFVEFDLWTLVDSFSRLYQEKKSTRTDQVFFRPETYTVEQRKNYVADIIRSKKEVLFLDLFREEQSRSKLVVTFLSILELLKDGVVDIIQSGSEESIKIVLRDKNE